MELPQIELRGELLLRFLAQIVVDVAAATIGFFSSATRSLLLTRLQPSRQR